jgi:hypothetical protein
MSYFILAVDPNSTASHEERDPKASTHTAIKRKRWWRFGRGSNMSNDQREDRKEKTMT